MIDGRGVEHVEASRDQIYYGSSGWNKTDKRVKNEGCEQHTPVISSMEILDLFNSCFVAALAAANASSPAVERWINHPARGHEYPVVGIVLISTDAGMGEMLAYAGSIEQLKDLQEYSAGHSLTLTHSNSLTLTHSHLQEDSPGHLKTKR